MTQVRKPRQAVKAKIVNYPSIPDPLSCEEPDRITQVKTTAPDGFGCEVNIVAECDEGFGGPHQPHIAVSMTFIQQHAAELRGSYYDKEALTVEQPIIVLHAWGGEAWALPDVLRKAADAAEAALKARMAADKKAA